MIYYSFIAMLNYSQDNLSLVLVLWSLISLFTITQFSKVFLSISCLFSPVLSQVARTMTV